MSRAAQAPSPNDAPTPDRWVQARAGLFQPCVARVQERISRLRARGHVVRSAALRRRRTVSHPVKRPLAQSNQQTPTLPADHTREVLTPTMPGLARSTLENPVNVSRGNISRFDNPRERAQTVPVTSSASISPDAVHGGDGGQTKHPHTMRRRRRLPNPTEQARRKAWGQTWGSVGHEWKTQHPDEGM